MRNRPPRRGAPSPAESGLALWHWNGQAARHGAPAMHRERFSEGHLDRSESWRVAVGALRMSRVDAPFLTARAGAQAVPFAIQRTAVDA
jgi:hypothetical protein